jgi:HlyD family secretion protein
LLLVVVVAVIAWGILKRNTPPAIGFTRVKRETLVSTLPTNGKVEPFQWQAVHAQAEGLVTRVDAVEGGAVSKGAVLAIITDPSKQSDIDTAQAKVKEAEANLASLQGGPRPAE